MAESVSITGTTKEERYASLLSQLKALAEDDAGQMAVLGNLMSAIKYGMNFYWVGLYEVKNNVLVLHTFQGTVACTKIDFGKGVCGYAWKNKETVIVADVNKFEGHIACSSESKSEIVLPVFDKKGEVKMVFDIDSDQFATFDNVDKQWLAKVVEIIERIINK
jgi:L-methionine (R)-S-oxide reductase